MAVFSSVQTRGAAMGENTRSTTSTQTTADDGDILDTGTARGSARAHGRDPDVAFATTGGEGGVLVEDWYDFAAVFAETGGVAVGKEATSASDLWVWARATPGADIVFGQARSKAAGDDYHDAWAEVTGYGDVVGGGGNEVDNPHHAFAIDTAVAIDLP